MLRDVEYVIEAHFNMTEKANTTDNPGKFQDIFKRRLQSGKCYHTPYFGTRECPVYFEPCEENTIKTAYAIMPSLVGSEMCIRDSCMIEVFFTFYSSVSYTHLTLPTILRV